ncbi:MAG: AAA family ATPase [Caldilineaceae bacterium]
MVDPLWFRYGWKLPQPTQPPLTLVNRMRAQRAKLGTLMRPKLPIGIQTFAKIRTEDYLYVDKTELIYRLITSGDYFFLSRPRRFGKSLTLSTIKSIYVGERELFRGLWIEDQWDWQKVHPVLHFSFSSIGYEGLGLETAIEAELHTIGMQAGFELSEKGIVRLFRELLRKLAVKGKVVVLIDEYDKPLIDYLDKPDKARENQEILKAFYSVIKDSDPYIEFLLLTGVSKFTKVSVFPF